MKIKVIDMDHKGNGIGKIDNKIIFIPKSITNDVCDIEIVDKHKNYDMGKVNKILEEGEGRVKAKCPYYDICGGCNISNLSYDNQLLFKKNKIINIFKKYLNMDINPDIIGSNKIYEYRNKITYHNNKCLGLVGEYDDIIDIDRCLLVSDKVNKLYNLIKKEDLSLVNKIIIRECNNGLMLMVDGTINIDNFKDMCIAIYINNKCEYKVDDGYIFIKDIKYKVSINSFFQVNSSNIYKLYDVIVKYGDFHNSDRVIDLYCGVGSISLYIAKYVKSVLGIEIIEDAIKDANKNKEINNINNVEFICGDVAKLVDNNILGDAIVVDPPRVGLDKHTISVINNSNIKKVVYVSCDPITLARDIKIMDNYILKDIVLVDMFPQTHHCETICILERR